MKGIINVAALVVVVMLTILAAAFLLNAYGVVTGHFEYKIDTQLIDLMKIVFTAAVSVLTLGGIAMVKQKEAEQERAFQQEQILPVPVDAVVVKPEEIDPDKLIQDAEIITMSAMKFEKRTELEHEFPGTWDGEISIMEIKDDEKR